MEIALNQLIDLLKVLVIGQMFTLTLVICIGASLIIERKIDITYEALGKLVYRRLGSESKTTPDNKPNPHTNDTLK